MSGAAGSGLLLPTLDELIADAGQRSGVLAVLDAADKLHSHLAKVRLWPPTHYAKCVCGAVMEIYGDLSNDDYEAIDDFADVHADCEADA